MKIRRFLGASACIAAFAAVISGCAKEQTVSKNTEEKVFFEAWIQVHHPDAIKRDGIYIIEDKKGTEKESAADSQFVYMSYTVTDLAGNITGYTEEETAKKLGEYNQTLFYGPKIMANASGFMQAGVHQMITGMQTGGTRKAVIPGWLMTSKWYNSEQEYLDNATGTNSICEITIHDAIKNIDKWQIDSIGRFISKDRAELNKDFKYLDFNKIFAKNDTVKNESDSTSLGFYYLGIKDGKPLKKKDDKEIPGDSHFFTSSGSTDTTIYINYVGRLLNGMVFDTNIKRVAQDNGLSGGKYEPLAIKWADSFDKLIMGTDSEEPNMIAGFAKTLWQMHPYEKGLGIFYSRLGYGIGGSGKKIPGYSPLIFEIEIVEKEEK